MSADDARAPKRKPLSKPEFEFAARHGLSVATFVRWLDGRGDPAPWIVTAAREELGLNLRRERGTQ